MILECIIIAVLGLSIGLLWKYSNPLNRIIRSRPLTSRKDRYRNDCFLCNQAKKCLQRLYKQAQLLHREPDSSEKILQRLQYLLPAGVIFKEQRDRIHNLAERIYTKLMNGSGQGQRNGNSKLRRRINTLLRNLNHSATEQEMRINNLLRLAESYTAVEHFSRLRHCVKAAVGLQHSSGKLLKNIYRVERHLAGILRKTTGHANLILLLTGDNKIERFI